MSGLNPFRPKKPEKPTAHQFPHHHHQSSSPLPTAPDPIFFTSTSAAPPPQPYLSSSIPPHQPTTAPPAIVASDIDESVTSDEHSIVDPFHQGSDLSDDEDVEGQQIEPAVSIAAPGDDHRSRMRPQEPTRGAPLSASSSPPSTLPRRLPPGTDPNEPPPQFDSEGGLHESPSIASSSVSIRSLGVAETDSNVDDFQPSIRTGPTSRPVSSAADIDPGVLISRPGNREKKPPPPPKSHHGKLISSDTSTATPTPQTTLGRSVNRLSYHAISPGTSLSPRPAQATNDYFAPHPSEQTAASTESLRRSQSQHKRPPTPPLSRRHSQMRRSKSTLSKPTASRLSMPPTASQPRGSPPSSPGSRPLTPSSRGRDPPIEMPLADEPVKISKPQGDHVTPTLPIPPSDAPGSTPNPKRASLANALPPPPPPRRSRGLGNRNGDNNRTASLQREQRADTRENFVPHPSNANDILADLSRLQKEVDDLRGHYEGRRAS